MNSDRALLLVRLRSRQPDGSVVGETWRTCHLVPVPDTVAVPEWVSIGDEEDLEHLRQENYGIASRGDSIHTDIHSATIRHGLYVEAVTDAQCHHGCTR